MKGALFLAAGVAALPAFQTNPPNSLSLGVEPPTLAANQTTFFDICNVCTVINPGPIMKVLDPCSDLNTSGNFSFQSECAENGRKPILVKPGSNIWLKIHYDPSKAKKMQFVLRYNFPLQNHPSAWNDTRLDDGGTFDPNGFYPVDRGRAGFLLYNVTIPNDIIQRRQRFLFGGGHFQLGYFLFNQNEPNYNFWVVRNISVRPTNQSWVTVSGVTVFNPSATLDPSDTGIPVSSATNAPPVYLFFLAGVAAVAVIVSTALYVVGVHKLRGRKRNQPSDVSLLHVSDFHERTTPPASAVAEPLYVEHDSDEDSVVVFKKTRSGAYTPSMSSRHTGGGSSVGSHPRSILKTSRQVQDEAITANMYDTTAARMQSTHQEDAIRRHDGVGVSKKHVAFKNTVDTAVVDMSMPPAIGAVPNGLFDDSESEGGEGEDEEVEVIRFNDGGVEKGMREVLGKAVEVDEDTEGAEASDLEDDGWRQAAK
ncbi:hypothetical protein HDU98_010852 [Podochytrium sp. JEL0797]|nr:hypothetical protein HDU98_010852 [Podochytrium sp. JEL0797]